MRKFTIRPHGHTTFSVDAETHEEAASIALANLYAGEEKLNILPQRTTGEHGQSGWFRGWYWDAKVQCLHSIGQHLYVG